MSISNDAVASVKTRQDLGRFIRALAKELDNPDEAWENQDLYSFLEAMAAWVDDMDGYYLNKGEAIPRDPSWGTIAQILLAATAYE